MINIKENISVFDRQQVLDYLLIKLRPYRQHIKLFDPDSSTVRHPVISNSINIGTSTGKDNLRKFNQPISGDVGNWAFGYIFTPSYTNFAVVVNIYKHDDEMLADSIARNIQKDLISKFPFINAGLINVMKRVVSFGCNFNVRNKNDLDKSIEVVKYMYSMAKKIPTLYGGQSGRKKV